MTDLPIPEEGLLVTQFLVVRDVAASLAFYVDVLGATALQAGPPAMVRLSNSWIILNTGGGPTPDKPNTSLVVPEGVAKTSAFMNLRVADMERCYAEWTGRGARFLTPPVTNPHEIRGYLVDPDDHLIEVGQAI